MFEKHQCDYCSYYDETIGCECPANIRYVACEKAKKKNLKKNGDKMKITLKNTLAHFKKICVHKYWVAYYCFKAGIIWQGLMHDMSKFSWIEFWESVRYYQGTSSPINACKADKGYSLAWQHHKGRNPHHYEYWTDRYDDGTVALEMPYKYAVELACDWLGAARAYLGKDFTYQGEYKWLVNKLKNTHPKINENTAKFVLILFKCLAGKEAEGEDPNTYICNEVINYIYHSSKRVKESLNEIMED